MGIRDAIEQEDMRFRDELKREIARCPFEELEAVYIRICEESKERQRRIFEEERWGN